MKNLFKNKQEINKNKKEKIYIGKTALNFFDYNSYNYFIAGEAGSGQTIRFMIPNICAQKEDSLIILDFNKEIYKKCKKELENNEYKIICYDFLSIIPFGEDDLEEKYFYDKKSNQILLNFKFEILRKEKIAFFINYDLNNYNKNLLKLMNQKILDIIIKNKKGLKIKIFSEELTMWNIEFLHENLRNFKKNNISIFLSIKNLEYLKILNRNELTEINSLNKDKAILNQNFIKIINEFDNFVFLSKIMKNYEPYSISDRNPEYTKPFNPFEEDNLEENLNENILKALKYDNNDLFYNKKVILLKKENSFKPTIFNI